jgi:hypothetical protein
VSKPGIESRNWRPPQPRHHSVRVLGKLISTGLTENYFLVALEVEVMATQIFGRSLGIRPVKSASRQLTYTRCPREDLGVEARFSFPIRPSSLDEPFNASFTATKWSVAQRPLARLLLQRTRRCGAGHRFINALSAGADFALDGSSIRESSKGAESGTARGRASTRLMNSQFPCRPLFDQNDRYRGRT